MRVALDTNVLAYAEGVNAVERREAATDLLRRLPEQDVVIPVQTLGELFHVLTRRAGRTHSAARDALIDWRATYAVVATSEDVLQAAGDLATAHGLGIWDAVILSAASVAGSRLLLSEDLQDGFTWGGVTVVNPFAATRHPLLQGILDGNQGVS